jgi:serine/threonine protein kinase
MDEEQKHPNPEDIFNDALELGPRERPDYLARVCAGDESLRSQIEEMLSIAARNPYLIRPPSDVEIPESLGHYRIVRECGRGGMGVVYEAIDVRLGRHVAVKVLTERFSEDGAALERFEREARLLASLNHQRIATLFNLEDLGGARFFAMEFVGGRTLAEALRDGPLPVRRVLEIGLQIVEALEYAHASGVVHRDLKPANIMVTPDGSIKVLDFGIARTLGMDSRPGTPTGSPLGPAGALRGTPGYMSPEQLLGRSVDHRADLWALGCVLYECLTGRPAFPSTTQDSEEFHKLMPKPRVESLPSGVSPAVRALIRSCLEVDPARRPASCSELRRTFQRALRREPRWLAFGWRMAAFAALGVAAVLLVTTLRSPSRTLAAIEITDLRSAKAIDENGHVLWVRQFSEYVQESRRTCRDPITWPLKLLFGKPDRKPE